MKLIIAGSRDITDFDILLGYMSVFPPAQEITEIVSGGARGVDQLGIDFAKLFDYPLTLYPANWSLGKAAGYLRNTEMAKYADCLVALWDGQSKGTKHMIDIMTKEGKPVYVYRIDENK